MKKSGKRVVSLPSVRENDRNLSYIARSIDNAKKGCYENNRCLKIDEGYGDYNMKLFRLKSKRDYVRNIPTIFSNSFKNLLQQHPKHEDERRIVTQHNERISQILVTPKEVYLEQIRLERERKERRLEEEKQRIKYVKGFDEEVREINDQLSFEYLPSYEANNWFRIKDNSSAYQSPVFVPPPKQYFTTPKVKPKRRKGHIFLSDNVRKVDHFRKL